MKKDKAADRFASINVFREGSAMTEQMKKQIDDVFHLWQDGVCPGGQVLIRQGGQIVYDRCFGYADIENRLPVTEDTVFHVASVSKQLTVFAALLLREDGLLDIDKDVRAYIPDLIRFDEPVKVRNLINNNSGIRDIWTLEMARGVRIDDTITQKDAVDIIANQTQLNFPPETQYMYSNSNFVLLAEIVERLAGKSLNDFLRERVFEPLGMKSTVIRDRYWQRIDNRARSFWDNGTEYFHSVLNYGSYGSTSLHTTAHDFMKWMAHYQHPTLCSQETIGLMMTVPALKGGAPTDYAGGLMIGELCGHRYFKHGGADAAFRSIVVGLPDDGIELVILSNTQNTPTDPAAMAVLRILLGLEAPARPEPEAAESFDPSTAPGVYYADLPDAITLDVVEENGKLYMTETFDKAPLVHVRGNLYRVGHLDQYLLLGPDAPGIVMSGSVMKLQKADPSPAPGEQLLRYEGRYVSSEIETAYEVEERDGALYLHHFRNGQSRLYPIAHDRFVTDGRRGAFVQFTRGSGGTVIGLTMSFGRVQNLPFSRED